MRSRRAFAVAAALCAVVVIAALITGAFFASAQETAATRLGIIDQQAFGAAEQGAARALASWDAAAMDAMNQGSTTTLASFTTPPTASTIAATKLDTSLFVIAAKGRVTTADAERIHRTVTLLIHAQKSDSGRFVLRRVREQAWSEAY
jgi:hypothetical protein